jgi:tartrate dehydratase beta subunit/fumarate hydratase class I family protein
VNKPTRGQGGDICAAAEHREDEANARAEKAEALAAELTAALEALKARAALAADVITEARHIEWKSLGLVKALAAFDRSVAPMVWGVQP